MTVSQGDGARFGFPLDHFQKQAISVLSRGDSVLVSAPTGSGKTVVAEYAIDLARSRAKRAIYTAPIKALSNQKFNDLVSQYGKSEVGLLTGDTSINSDAPILVMTTEVLRNMIYARANTLKDLGVVILDEVHYLQDAYRGPVWEEVIIHLDPDVQLVCLSATVSNAQELTDWLSIVRGTTEPIVETTRPVALINHYLIGNSASHQVEMFETVVNDLPNPRVLQKERRSAIPVVNKGRSRSQFFTPDRVEVATVLQTNDLLPAIVFIFSRNQCDLAADSCVKAGIRLTTRQEREKIIEIVMTRSSNLGDEDLAALGFSRFVRNLELGIGSHHAGLVPVFKEIVEECFIAGLVKLVFATETLAVGLNMPARAVVIEKVTKFNGEDHQTLKAADYTQLTGRAGRRGIDSVGHALVLWNPYVSFQQVADLAMSRSFRLTSAFRPTYNMTANLIQSHSRLQSHHLLNLSFAQFQSARSVVELQARISRLEGECKKQRQHSVSRFGDIDEYRRPIKTQLGKTIASEFDRLEIGDVFEVQVSNHLVRAVVFATAERSKGRKLSLITAEKTFMELIPRQCESVPRTIGHIRISASKVRKSPKLLRTISTQINSIRVPRSHTPDHPIAQDPDLNSRLVSARTADRLDKEIEGLQKRIESLGQSVGRQFDNLVLLLESLEYVDGWALTEKGKVLSRIYHELDLVIAEVLFSGVLDALKAPDLAALLSVFVYENRGPTEGDVIKPKHCLCSFDELMRTYQMVQDSQMANSIPLHRAPDGGLVDIIFDWANGADLVDLLSESLTAGDFVRTVRQLIDLLRQISEIAGLKSLRDESIKAIRLIYRGVVASSYQPGAT